VNTVSPGYIGTDMVRAVRPEILDAIVKSIPIRRLGEATEIASIVSWLASDEAAFATGMVRYSPPSNQPWMLASPAGSQKHRKPEQNHRRQPHPVDSNSRTRLALRNQIAKSHSFWMSSFVLIPS